MIEKICNADIILMQGLPASGKSSLNNIYINNGYKIVSRDKIGCTMAGVLQYIRQNKLTKIVVDATFPTVESRESFINYAKEKNLTIGCHRVKTSKEDCLINAMLRSKKITGEFYYHFSELPDEWKKNPQVFVIPVIFKQVKEAKIPRKIEGFDEIISTPFERVWEDGYTNKAVFVDFDGTIRETIDDDSQYPYPVTFHNQRILSNSEEVLREYKEKGYLIIGVSNQSGINKGHFIDDVDGIFEETKALLNNGGENIIDDYMYCPHSMPAQICACRKPQSGMGLYFRDKYKLDLSKCIMVGDRTTDKTFATRLGITYFDQKQFFKR